MSTVTELIGRKEQISILNKTIFAVDEASYGENCSICGPHGIGKTFLIDFLRQTFEQRHRHQFFPHEYCFYREIENNENKTLLDFKVRLLREFRKRIPMTKLECEFGSCQDDYAEDTLYELKYVYELLDRQPNRGEPGYDSWCGEIDSAMDPQTSESVFYNYTKLGIRIILILDEFDRAEKGYPLGDIFQWLFSLSNKSSGGMHYFHVAVQI